MYYMYSKYWINASCKCCQVSLAFLISFQISLFNLHENVWADLPLNSRFCLSYVIGYRSHFCICLWFNGIFLDDITFFFSIKIFFDFLFWNFRVTQLGVYLIIWLFKCFFFRLWILLFIGMLLKEKMDLKTKDWGRGMSNLKFPE